MYVIIIIVSFYVLVLNFVIGFWIVKCALKWTRIELNWIELNWIELLLFLAASSVKNGYCLNVQLEAFRLNDMWRW
jgi:hypothetical protein